MIPISLLFGAPCISIAALVNKGSAVVLLALCMAAELEPPAEVAIVAAVAEPPEPPPGSVTGRVTGSDALGNVTGRDALGRVTGRVGAGSAVAIMGFPRMLVAVARTTGTTSVTVPMMAVTEPTTWKTDDWPGAAAAVIAEAS